jgi:ABC-type phosphate transport system substrate-binding protein
MRRFLTFALAASVVAGATATAVVAAPALADPTNGHGKAVTPKATDIVGVGSDTNEFLFDQFSVDYNKAFPKNPQLYSWDALNPKTGLTDNIATKAGCSKIPRPDGGSAGLLAFYANTVVPGHTKDFCIDYVRSTRGRSSKDPAKAKGGVVFVVLAKDAITYATNGGKAGTNAPRNLTTAQLAAIYTCTDTTWNQVGGTSSKTIQPFLPQTGSGLRSSFLKIIGVLTPGTCVNSTVQQNEGTDKQLLNNPNALVPYSVAKYLSQVYRSNPCTGPKVKGKNQFGCDQHGELKLNSINGTKPTVGKGSAQTINPAFTPDFINTIYDVVRWARTPDNIPGYLEKIFASARAKVKGWACTFKTARQDVINYGFLPTPLCGLGT